MAEQEELIGGASKEEAQSFITPEPPKSAKLVEQKVIHGRTYNYYQDDAGGWWYDTDKGQEINRKIAEWGKKNKKILNRRQCDSVNSY